MNKNRKQKGAEAFCITVILIFLFLLVRILYQPEATTERLSISSLGSGWYQIRDGEKITLELPCRVLTDADGKAVLYNDTLSAEDEGKIVSTRGIQDHLEAYMGDRLLYHYNDNSFLRNKPMKGKLWADICLPDETGEEPLCFIFEGKENSLLYVQAPILGSFSSVIRHHLQASIFLILMVLGMLGMGIVAVIVFLYARHRQMMEKRFLNVAFFLILCSLWCIFDSGLYQMYGRQSAAGTLISFYAFMLMSIPILRFVQNTVRSEVRWIPQIWVFLFYGNAILQGILNLLFQIPFIQMLFLTHLFLFTGVASMILLLWNEYRKTGTQELSLCLKAFAGLGISGVLALVLYWIFSIYWYDTVFQFGILLYIAFLFWGLLCKVANDSQFRLEQAVYERMSLEDRMTGLKNRKAFEKCLEKIQEDSLLLGNALLLFIDIAGLKEINDTYGMQLGDEAVIRTARSIQAAGNMISEQQAECFRIDGDEFAVVVTDPQKLPSEWIRLIKAEMENEAAGKHHIRLKFGYSYLRKTDGVLNSVSNWKLQADRMQHYNKEETAEADYDL